MGHKTAVSVRSKRGVKSGAWHLDAAFALGRTTKKIANTMGSATKIISAKLDKNKRSEEPVSPILREIKGIIEVSGLSDAIREMNEIGLEHSKHPVIARLTAKIERLSRAEQEALSRRFIAKLGENAQFVNATRALPLKVNLSEDDCQRMSDSLIESVFLTLEETGIVEDEGDILRQMTGEIARPINDLIQFYIKPKTFSEKVKRLWRMQRIFIKTVSLIVKMNALAPEIACGASGTYTIDPLIRSYGHALDGQVIDIEATEAKTPELLGFDGN